MALGFLRAIRYHGPGGVQLERDGRFYLVEVNGRLMGANIHLTRCGVNLPMVAYLAVLLLRPS